MTANLATSAGIVTMLMLGLWIVATWRRDVSLVDLFWGPGFALVAWAAAWRNGPVAPRVMLLIALTTVWAVRLSLYLTWRNWGRLEDRRYAAMRERHGKRFAYVSLFTVFGLQGVLMWFVSLPLQAAAVRNDAQPLGLPDFGGLALWFVGMLFEVGGDWQLARFLADPANHGRVMDRGFWRYTRHPNYFGDSCVWWGLYLIAAAGGAGATVLSPIVMSVLLIKVSGVALLESTIAQRRPEYAEYLRRTNAFFPGPRRTIQ